MVFLYLKMKKSNEVVRPRYTNEDLANFNYHETSLKFKNSETIRLDKKKNFKISQKVGLYVGLLGVVSALGGGVSQAKPSFETVSEPKNKVTTNDRPTNLELIWEEVMEKIGWGGTKVASSEVIEEVEQVVNTDSDSNQVKDETVLTETITPTTLAQSISFAEVDTLTPTPDPMEKVPSSFTLPFEYLAPNKIMGEYNLNLRDLYFPADEKIKDFNALYVQNEVLPIFSNDVMAWESLIIDLTNKHNKNNPQNPISANFIAAIMSIESQGNPNAYSYMGAMGLMQITTPAANAYGYNAQNIFIPENNIQASIKYFADQKNLAKSLGLQDNQVWEFAAMQYNGGWNADKFFDTNRVGAFIKNESIADQIKKADSQEKVREVLVRLYGTDTAPGHEYWTYGTKLTKVETLKYREKLLRFVVVAEIASELKKRGYSEDQIREFLKTPTYIKRVNFKIKNQLNINLSYFKQKEIYLENLQSNQSLGDLPEYADSVSTSPADYLMYR